MKDKKYVVLQNRIYLQNERFNIRYWKTKELCRHLGITGKVKKEDILKASDLYLKMAVSEGAKTKYVGLVKKACRFCNIGEGIFDGAYAGLAGEIILTHPLKALSEKENRILAAAVSLLHLPESDVGEKLDFLKEICPGKKNRRTALLICRAVRQAGVSGCTKKYGFHSVMEDYILRQVSAAGELSSAGNLADAEVVHDIRVAYRRLMSLCKVFHDYLDSEWVNTFYPGFCTTLNILGKARDLDVMSEKIDIFLKADDSGSASLSVMGGWLKSQADECRAKADIYFSSNGYAEFLLKLRESLKGCICRPVLEKGCSPMFLQPRRICLYFLSQTFAQAGAYEEWLSGRWIAEPMLHHLRLVYKDMRFILEFFSDFLEPEELLLLEHCRKIQDILGSLHDYSVIIRRTKKAIHELEKSGEKITEEEKKTLDSFIIWAQEERKISFGQYLKMSRR